MNSHENPPSAEFSADFPDDMIEDDDGIVQFGGQGIALAITELMRAAGYEASIPEYQGEHGWDFVIKSGPTRVWVQISQVDDQDCTLMTEQMGLIDRLLRKQAYADILLRLNTELRRDPRFSQLKWVEDNAVLRGVPGSPEPVIA